MTKPFNLFLSQLSKTNATLDYFVDFNKVTRNVHKIAIKLNQLNYLIGKENIEEAINELYEENPKVFEVLDILIAVRNKKTKTFNNNGIIVSLESYFSSPTNLVDYVFGIEVGLDTNARKNRGGDNMSKAVSLIFDREGIYYKKEVNSTLFLDIESLGVDVKRFDFVIKTKKKTYLIETNFYNTGGSKLNEVARAYSEVAPKINQYENYEFVWITDGQGWLKAKNKLEEAYNIIPSVYNLTTLEEFVEKVKKEEIENKW